MARGVQEPKVRKHVDIRKCSLLKPFDRITIQASFEAVHRIMPQRLRSGCGLEHEHDVDMENAAPRRCHVYSYESTDLKQLHPRTSML